MAIATMTSDDLAARTRRAVAAAADAGRELGLRVSTPRVLHDVFCVIVHLDPSPVVARVPVVLPPELDAAALRARQARELSAVVWLAAGGHGGSAAEPARQLLMLAEALAPMLEQWRTMTLAGGLGAGD